MVDLRYTVTVSFQKHFYYVKGLIEREKEKREERERMECYVWIIRPICPLCNNLYFQ